MVKKKIIIARGVAYGLTAVAMIFGVYLLGFTQGYYQKISAQNLGEALDKQFSSYYSQTPNANLFSSVSDLLKEKYYGDIDYISMLYGSIKGAVAGLGDPYTSFSTPEENKEFFTDLNGVYEGVGLEIDMVDDKLMVVTPVEGAPAAKAGILPKDQILAVDGTGISGMSLSKVVNMLKGAKGTKVNVMIYRESADKIMNFILTRDSVVVKSVKLEIRPDKIAIIKITKFNEDTDKLFGQAVKQILTSEAKGIVLDLRNNPGGFLDAGVKVANEFLDGGLIVEEHFKDGKITPFSADGNGKLSKLPVMILVDGGSASAAEIVAGALRDNKRATIIGETTYGKGSVQEIEEFPDGSALRVTIAHWYTPSGVSISEAGINPDIVLKRDDKEADNQLNRAIQELNKTK